MTHLVTGLLALALSGAPATDPLPGAFHLELRAGLGTGEFHGSASGENRSAGANWGIRMGFQPHDLVVFGLGYGQSSFGCQGGLCAQSPVTYSGSGVEVEAATNWHHLRLGAGLTRQILGAEWTDAEDVTVTAVAAPAIGWFVTLSADVPLAQRFSVAPGVRYMRHGADFGSGNPRTAAQIMANVALRYRLPSGR